MRQSRCVRGDRSDVPRHLRGGRTPRISPRQSARGPTLPPAGYGPGRTVGNLVELPDSGQSGVNRQPLLNGIGGWLFVEFSKIGTACRAIRTADHELETGQRSYALPTGSDADAAAMDLPMSGDQLMAYTKALAIYRQAQSDKGKERANSILRLLQRLRMVCAYPMAELRADHEQASVAEHLRVSPKLTWLIQRLDDISRRGEKAIVFTDYRVVQRLIQRAVEHRFGFRPCIINGSTTANAASDRSRQKLIDEFQQEEGFGVLILGTTAVGFGVNIQEANHVIHFTRSWNPAKEDQATDRAYRIGQTRDVYVYCPTVAGNGFESFEQRLAERLDYKRGLSADMLAGPQELSMEDFGDL